jgi:glycerol-3-phosphate dehydrogenase (NAD(P)+)
MQFNNITIIGAGAFGFAITKHLSSITKDKEDYHFYDKYQNSNIFIYDVDKDVINYMKENRSQKNFFPNTFLNDSVIPTTDLEYAISNSDLIIIAIPTQFIRGFLVNAKQYLREDVVILNCSKGFEISTGKLISDLVQEELVESNIKPVFATLSGGMIASEFVDNLGIFGAEIACENKEIGIELQKLFSSRNLRIYLNDDVKGVECAGALKNVISIASGIVDGLGYPYGSKTMIVALGGQEIMNLSIKLGAREHTFNLFTQAFGNDYMMSATGNTRNRYLGELLGQGLSSQEAMEVLRKEKKTAEGYYTAKAAFELSKKYNLKTPIIDDVYKILYENMDAELLVKHIMKEQLELIHGCKFCNN